MPERSLLSSNAVIDWAQIAQQAIHNPSAPRPPGSAEVLHTMVVLAMYDAVVAVEGGYRPYALAIPVAPRADIRTTVATAAYLTARARIATSQVPQLDQQYVAYLASIVDGEGKREGIRVGTEVASTLLAHRANDGLGNDVLYRCRSSPPHAGEFEPDPGCPILGRPQPVDMKLCQVLPFTFPVPSQFRPGGPSPLTSRLYTDDFIETRDHGSADSALRTPEQTDVAYFWSEHSYVHWNQNLIRLAIARGLSLRETARFFALVHTAAADATIAAFEAKYRYAAWRPRTAIPRADSVGNPETPADPSWRPLLTENHPEYPCAHGSWSTAVVDAVASYFGTRTVPWTLVTSPTAVPLLVQTERTFGDLDALTREAADARVWAGLHWRHSLRHGAELGRRVAAHVARHYFQPVP